MLKCAVYGLWNDPAWWTFDALLFRRSGRNSTTLKISKMPIVATVRIIRGAFANLRMNANSTISATTTPAPSPVSREMMYGT
jgi:hypothetical protein